MQQYIFGTRYDADAKVKPGSDVKVFNARKIAPNLSMSKAYSTYGHDSGAARGGETIPTPLADRFIDLVEEFTFCRQLFKTQPMKAATLEIPIRSTGPSTFLMGEGLLQHADAGAGVWEGGVDQASTSISRSTWTSLLLTAKKLGNLSGYTTELADDSLLNWAEVTLGLLARSEAEGFETAVIEGDISGTCYVPAAGDPRKAWDGLMWHVNGTNASTGAKWTPGLSTETMWAHGGSNKLTAQELNDMIARIEEEKHKCEIITMRPKVRARMRDSTEFEQLQTLKDLGNQAALIRGGVGKYYTAQLVTSSLLPTGKTTGFGGTGQEWCNATAVPYDTHVLGFDPSAMVIGDRKRIEVRRRQRFYLDIEEVLLSERVAFDVEYPLALAGISQVSLAA